MIFHEGFVPVFLSQASWVGLGIIRKLLPRSRTTRPSIPIISKETVSRLRNGFLG